VENLALIQFRSPDTSARSKSLYKDYTISVVRHHVLHKKKTLNVVLQIKVLRIVVESDNTGNIVIYELRFSFFLLWCDWTFEVWNLSIVFILKMNTTQINSLKLLFNDGETNFIKNLFSPCDHARLLILLFMSLNLNCRML
jgi:hypothetical protein